MLAGSVAARTFSAALALVGGPVGAVILGVGVAATYFASKAQEASVAAQRYSSDLDKFKASGAAAADAIKHVGDAAAETAPA